MPEINAAESSSIIVHGLLVCRNVRPREDGQVDLEEVLEVVEVDGYPGNAGPLTFVAFLRQLPTGKANVAFVIRPAGVPDEEVSRLALDVVVPDTPNIRQVAVQMRAPEIPVKQGGWFEVSLEWDGKKIGWNLFAIGSRSAPTDPATPANPA